MSFVHSCPFCRNSQFNHIHDKCFDRRIQELSVTCSNASEGCEWTGCLADLKYHLNTNSDKACLHQIISCPLNCGNLYERKDINVHVSSECTQRKVGCEYCTSAITFSDMEQHLSECQLVLIPCPKECGKLVKRCDSEFHVNGECTSQITSCLFRDVGCEAVVKAKDYDDHVEKCQKKYMVKAHKKLLDEMKSLKDEVLRIRGENQFLHSKVASLHAGLTISYENAEFLKQENAQLKGVLCDELLYLHALAKPWESLSVDCIKTHLRGQVVHLVPGKECATFRITNYSELKKTGGIWYSSSFYMAEGYNFCLAIHPNGVGAGKGTHLAICLHQWWDSLTQISLGQ